MFIKFLLHWVLLMVLLLAGRIHGYVAYSATNNVAYFVDGNSRVSSSRGILPNIRKMAGNRNGVLLKSGKDSDEFWTQQKALMEEMTGRAEKSLKQEQREKFASRRAALIADTALFTALIFSLLWVLSVNPFVSFSYALGAGFGLAYAYGLGKYVETLGGSAADTEAVQGAGIGQARFAFLILLFLFVGRFRSSGLIEIPSIAGFFTYQLASLSQGLREIND